MISLIYARSLDHCIGNNGLIPWHLPDEFSHFEQTTLGKPIIMGRKTYEDHTSALPGRLNVVISTQENYETVPGVELVHSIGDAMALARAHSEDFFVIGGVRVFTSALPFATGVYETIIDAEIAGDAVLPDFDFSDWDTELLQSHPIDARHEYAFKIYRHRRPSAGQVVPRSF